VSSEQAEMDARKYFSQLSRFLPGIQSLLAIFKSIEAVVGPPLMRILRLAEVR